MYAIIHEIESAATHGLIPIAGRPLVARQIQWLRSMRCQGIAVQIGTSSESVALGHWLGRGDAVGTNVRLVLSGKPLTPREIARRAGFPDDAHLLAIPADVLCGGDFDVFYANAHPDGAIVGLPPPSALADAFDGSGVRVFGKPKKPPAVANSTWSIRVRSLADAFAIGIAALEGRLERRSENGVLLHASERERGIWISRGAYVDPSAKLTAPVLVGANTVIRAGACVGPRVFLGERSVIEQGTRIADSMVAPGTIVGERLDLSGIAIDDRGTQDLATEEHATIDESLLLASRDKSRHGFWLGRSLALLLIVFLAPIWLFAYATSIAGIRNESPDGKRRSGLDLLAALLQTFRGKRSFIGLSDWTEDLPKDVPAALIWKSMGAPSGLIAIDAGLVPEGADASVSLRARVYYMHEKNAWLDVVLLMRCLGRFVAKYARKNAGHVAEESSPEMGALS